MTTNGMGFPIGAGVLGALITVAAATTQNVHVAVALPFVFLAGAVIVLRPFLGLVFLFFFALIDGISDLLFAALPISSYKLVSAATALGVLVSHSSSRNPLNEALALPVARWGFGFVACIPLSIVFATDRFIAIDSGTRLLSVMLLLFLTIILVRDMRQLRILLHFLVLSIVVSALILLVETSLGVKLVSTTKAATTAVTAEGFARSSGASQNDPTTAAIMMVSGVVLALLLALESSRYRAVFLAAAAIGSFALVMSFARSAALVYVIILVLLAIRYRRNQLMVPSLLIGCILVMAALPLVPESYFERFGSLMSGGEGDWTLGRRWTYQVIGFELLKDYPFFGVGPGNYSQLFTDPDFRFLEGRTLLGRPLHNMYLSVATEYGLIGFLFFIGMIAAAFSSVRSVIRNPANEELSELATTIYYAMLAFFIASLVVPNEYNKFTWIFLALAGAVGAINQKNSNRADTVKKMDAKV